MSSEPTLHQPIAVPAEIEQQGRSKKKIALLGCGGLLGLCVLFAIIGLLVSGGDDTEGNGQVASAPTVTIRSNATAMTTSAVTATESSGPASDIVTTTATTEASVAADPTNTDAATATSPPAPTAILPAPTPTAGAVGSGRTNPIPLAETGQAGDWEIQVLEVVRGDDAYSRLLEANQFNEAAPSGMEYVLVNVRVKYNGTESEAQSVDFTWFSSTGDSRVKWGWPSVVDPTPELDAELFTGAEATGWTTILARQGEQNLILIFEPILSTEEGDEAFLALQENASVSPLDGRLAEENDLGFDRMDPVPVGERIVGETWEIWVIESVRGEEALRRIKEANQFNEDPDPGMEYVLVRVGARNVNPDSGSDNISEFSFKTTGDAGRVYDVPSIVDPEPTLSYDVYAGGEVDGWITLQAAAGEENLRLVYEPAFSFTADPRYFAIQ